MTTTDQQPEGWMNPMAVSSAVADLRHITRANATLSTDERQRIENAALTMLALQDWISFWGPRFEADQRAKKETAS